MIGKIRRVKGGLFIYREGSNEALILNGYRLKIFDFREEFPLKITLGGKNYRS